MSPPDVLASARPLAYCAVAPEGRTDGRQIHWRSAAVSGLRRLTDGVRGGFGAGEAVTVAQWLENSMYLFKGDAPVKEFAGAFPGPLRPAVRVFAGKLIRPYPYRDAYLLNDARKIRAAVSLPLILLGGITNRQVMDQAMAEGFQFVAMGRALLMEPDLVNRVRADASVASRCVHCDKCMPTIYSAARCVLVEPEPRYPAPEVIS
ncbi:MAG: hypothetical protein ACRDN0_39725 [Trebonia sp.]